MSDVATDSQSNPIDMVAVEQQIRRTISEQIGLRLDEIKDSATFLDSLGADSLDMVEVVMALEEDFGIQIEDDAVEHIQTVRQMIDYAIPLIHSSTGANS